MPTPFPGMDPYLEDPTLWPDVHNALIAAIRDALAPQIRPRYYVAIEERATAIELPFGDERLGELRADVAIVTPHPGRVAGEAMTSDAPGSIVVEVPVLDAVRETFLELRRSDTHRLVTVIEVLSPTNKRAGGGRAQYLEKRAQILASETHLIEIDLLRAGSPMPLRGEVGGSDYRILLSRSEQRPAAELIPLRVRDPLPTITIPLLGSDPSPTLALNALLHALYDRAGYDLRIDYTHPPEPTLSTDDAAWAAQLGAHREH